MAKLEKSAPAQMAVNTITERRSGKDRRSRGWCNLVWLLKNGERRQVRRKSDRRRVEFLDYYSPKLFYALTVVLLLSITDAILTLWLIDHGANEMNPIMDYFLQIGPNTFMFVKYLITAIAVTIVVILNYGIIRHLKIPIRMLMPFFACCFGMVVVWELFLIARLLL